MKRFNIQAFSALGVAALSRAQSQSPPKSWWLQPMSGDVVPFVAFSTADVSDYFQYPATLLGCSGSESTFGVNCYGATASECFADTGFTSMTLVTGPETMEIFFSEDSVYVTTACTLTGSPFPTTGTCSETYSWNNVTTTLTTTSVYAVPYSTTSTIGGGSIWWLEDIYAATLAVVEGAAPTTTSAEVMSTGAGSAKTTTTPTVTSKATFSGKGSSASMQGSGSASASASASVTKNAAAMIKAAPRWMLIAGAVAGTAIAL